MERKTQSNTHHKDLLASAKQQQTANLHESAAASAQLVRAVEAIIKVNSATGQLGTCPPLLDKIATIHELDREIDRQLNCDIVHNYEALLDAKQKLARHVKRCQRALAIVPDTKGSYVDLLQHRVELIDQELRILELTSTLVQKNRPSA
ncbi:hypothetical protein JCM33374_g3188 [Metschnikowia sp. JCM 33374]|nr:hypothetical protein JCM33374_g3188 [Metschnikowia sp. JCM 33374]